MKEEILIIEDEAIIAADISDILTALDYRVAKIINSSEKAIDYLSFHSPDLVLCDINIKGSQDGIQVAEVIRKKKKVPFVFLTSLADRQTLDRAKKTLPYGYIVKPFDEKDILTAIEIALFKFKQEIEALRLTKDKVDAISTLPFTEKEFALLNDMALGLNYPEICSKQQITHNTLKYHTKNIFSKLQVHTVVR